MATSSIRYAFSALSLVLLTSCGGTTSSGGSNTQGLFDCQNYTYCFGVVAYNNTGVKSEISNLVGKNLSAGSSVTLRWSPPTEYTDDSPLSDLAGYIIYYYSSSDGLVTQIDVGNAGIDSYRIDAL